MRQVSAIVLLTALFVTGCATPRCEQARMKEMIVTGGRYQTVYDATERVLEKYFEIAYANPVAGIITTRYSQAKSADEGIVKIKAIATITEGKQGPHLNLKVVKERFQEMWDIWGHNIIEKEVFLGADKVLEEQILNEIEKALGQGGTKPAAALPTPAPAAAAPAMPQTPTVQSGPGPGKPSPSPPPAVVAFPPPPPAKK